MRNLALLMILAEICAIVGLASCKRSRLKERPQIREHAQARNLTPGLSEELTALARRHPGQWLFIVEPPDNEEARNLAGLIDKALEAGGWKVLAHVVSREPRQIQGLYCSYPSPKQKVADDLLSVFQQKDLLIECEQRDDGSRDSGRPMDFPAIVLEVGLKP